MIYNLKKKNQPINTNQTWSGKFDSNNGKNKSLGHGLRKEMTEENETHKMLKIVSDYTYRTEFSWLR